MYKIERNKKYTVQLALNDEVLNIKLDGLKQYKKYLEAQERLLDIQHKMEIMSKRTPEDKTLEEMITLLGETIIYMFTVLFGEDNTQKIVDFFEGNYDEMMTAVMPFITKEVIPTLKAVAKEQGKAVVERIKNVP